MMKKIVRRTAVWMTAFVLLAALSGGCFIAASAADGGNGIILTTDLVSVVDAEAAYSSDAGGVTVVGNGGSYSGQINGVFKGSVTLRMDFLGDEENVWVNGDSFRWTITDVSDPENSFYIEYMNTVTWAGIGYTIGHVYYKDQVRTAAHDNTSWDNKFHPGEYAMCAPQFPGGYGDTHAAADLKLVWDESGVLHVEAYRHGIDISRDIAAFDGTETFADKVSWGLPKLSFPDGYKITFESSETAPDICFQAITDGADKCDLNSETIAAPAFYTEWYDAWYEEWSAKPGVVSEKIVKASTSVETGYFKGYNGIGATGIMVNSGVGGDSSEVMSYTGKLGRFTGDSEINFMFVTPNEYGPTYAEFYYIISDLSGNEVFRVIYRSSHGYYTQAAVQMGDEVRSHSSYGNYTGSDNWYTTSTIYYTIPVNEQQLLRPGMGAGCYGAGTLKLSWSGDVLSVYAQGREREDMLIGKFDGSEKPATEQIGDDNYMTVDEGATWGLSKVYEQLKDGYTVGFSCTEKNNLPVAFLSINGVRLGVYDQVKVEEADVSAVYSFDLVEENGKYYVMQDTEQFMMTTDTAYRMAEGWYVDDTVTAAYEGAEINVGAPAEYTVGNATVVVEPSYSVTYDTAGGSGDYPAQVFSAHYTSAVVLPSTEPVKSGYTFAGWYNGETVWNGTAEEVAALTGNTTVTAKWTAETYEIVYNVNGGTLSGETTEYTIEDEVTLTAPKRTGYEFGGWYESADFEGSAVTSIPAGSTGDKTFYAKWTAETYEIVYNVNGGTLSGETTEYTIEDEVTLTAPKRAGYEFGGWYESADFEGGAVTSIPAGSTGDKTFYAKWTLETYKIEYVNATADDEGMESAPVSYDITSAAVTLTAPERAGYEFGGWYESADFEGSAVTSIPAGSTGDKTFYAKWTAETYEIVYNVNGGTLSGETTEYTIEDQVTLPEPERAGYEFGGWYESADFEGSAVTSIPAGSTGDKTFYAKWTEKAQQPAGGDDGADSDKKTGCGGNLAAAAALPAVVLLAVCMVMIFRRRSCKS